MSVSKTASSPGFLKIAGVLLLCLLSGVAVLLTALFILTGEGARDYVNRVAGLNLSTDAEEVESATSEFQYVAHFKLSPRASRALVASQRFSLQNQDDPLVLPLVPSHLPLIDQLSDEFRKFGPAPHVYEASGCSPGQSTWVALLDEANHRLWVAVKFPDYAGSDPGCGGFSRLREDIVFK